MDRPELAIRGLSKKITRNPKTKIIFVLVDEIIVQKEVITS
jgi:hypothetical protein